MRGLAGPKKVSEIEQLITQGRYKVAIENLEPLLEEQERNPRLRFMLAQCFMATEKWQKAVMHTRKLLKMGKFTPEITEVKTRKVLAKSLYEMNNLTEAKNEYLILTTLEPDNFTNFFKAGEIFFDSNVPAKALKFLQKAQKLNPRHAQTLSLMGQCHYQARNYNEARPLLTQAVEIKPDLHSAHYYLGLTLRYMGDLEWAIKELHLAEKDPDLKAMAMLAKGIALMDQDNYPRAITELDRALRHAVPKSELAIQAHYMMGAANEKSRDIPAAIQSWEILEVLKPGFRDVRDKLKQYKEFQTDDKIKDFLICGNAQFEGISRKIIESLGYSINELKMENDTIIHAIGSEKETAQRNARRNYCYFYIQRDMAPIKEALVRASHEKMKEQNAHRGYIITTSEFSPTAKEFALSRPLELVDSGALADVIKKALEIK